MADKDAFLLKLAQLHFTEGLDFGKIVAGHREELRDEYGIDVHLKNVGAFMHEAGQYLLREKERLDDTDAFRRGDIELGRKLTVKFPHLKAVCIATRPNPPSKADAIDLKFWPDPAVRLIDATIDAYATEGIGVHMALSGGELIFDLVNAFPYRRRTAHFYPAAVIGRAHTNDAGVPGPDTNATVAWAHSGRQPANLHLVTASPYDAIPPGTRTAPAIELLLKNRREVLDGSEELRDSLKNIRDKTNIILSSLGTPVLPVEPQLSADIAALMITSPFLQPYGIDMNAPEMAAAIGDIGHCFFGGAGEDHPEWRLLLTPGAGTKLDGIEFVKSVMRKDHGLVIVVAIGLGPVMIPVLLAAIYAQLMNVLICDRDTAETLLVM